MKVDMTLNKETNQDTNFFNSTKKKIIKKKK